MNEQDILEIIKKDKWMMEILIAVEKLELQDWWIGAGFVRSKVWDYLHGYRDRTPLPDIDVIYFNPQGNDLEEQKYWKILKSQFPDLKWSVTNTAFRHERLGRKSAYKSSTEALSEWVETATGIGVSLEKDKLKLSAPNGIEDLVNLLLKPTKKYKSNRELFYERIKDKKWIEKWPKLTVIK